MSGHLWPQIKTAGMLALLWIPQWISCFSLAQKAPGGCGSVPSRKASARRFAALALLGLFPPLLCCVLTGTAVSSGEAGTRH